jgi:hypothetical protein
MRGKEISYECMGCMIMDLVGGDDDDDDDAGVPRSARTRCRNNPLLKEFLILGRFAGLAVVIVVENSNDSSVDRQFQGGDHGDNPVVYCWE